VSQTTGPILALGTVTVVNATVFNDKPMDWRIPIATGLAAIGFSFAERVFPDGAQVLAWTALLSVLVTRTDPEVPSPVESALAWWKNSAPSGPSASSNGGGGGSAQAPTSKEV
jgi:hypothetical protein